MKLGIAGEIKRVSIGILDYRIAKEVGEYLAQIEGGISEKLEKVEEAHVIRRLRDIVNRVGWAMDKFIGAIENR